MWRGKQAAEAWAQSGGSADAPSYTDAEKWRAALSERAPQPLSVTPHAGGARTVLGNTGPSRSESAAVPLDSRRPPCRCKPWAQAWRPETPERCARCGGMFPPHTVAARR